MDKLKKDYEGKIEVMEGKVKRLEQEITELNKKLKDKEQQLEKVTIEKDGRIKDLEREI